MIRIRHVEAPELGMRPHAGSRTGHVPAGLLKDGRADLATYGHRQRMPRQIKEAR